MTTWLRKRCLSGHSAANARHWSGAIRPAATVKPREVSWSASIMWTHLAAGPALLLSAGRLIYDAALAPSRSEGAFFQTGTRDMAEPVQTDKEQTRLIRMAATISQALPYMRRRHDAAF